MSMKNRLNTKEITTDVLIIGGGTAGCYAALVLSEQKAGRVLIAEKANIKRSGCLAAGVNAINAYIVKGRKPQDYVDYATKDAAGIVHVPPPSAQARHCRYRTAGTARRRASCPQTQTPRSWATRHASAKRRA